MYNAEVRELQLKLLEIMKIFHNVCTKNNIKYYMLNGTMLGAVRHQGFIPWDDDMDIGMSREDYVKLLKLPESEWPRNIRIKTPNNSKDLIFPYSKIMDANTTLVENRLGGIVEGIYIDIFPLDGAGNNMISAKIRYAIYYWKQGLLYNNQDYGFKKTRVRRIIQSYARKKDLINLYSRVEKWMTKKDYNKSKIIGNYPGAWGIKEFMKKSIMGEPKLYKFEGYSFFGVEKYDEYLTSIYGNYRELPPKEKRKSHHNFIHLDLNYPFEKFKNINE